MKKCNGLFGLVVVAAMLVGGSSSSLGAEEAFSAANVEKEALSKLPLTSAVQSKRMPSTTPSFPITLRELQSNGNYETRKKGSSLLDSDGVLTTDQITQWNNSVANEIKAFLPRIKNYSKR